LLAFGCLRPGSGKENMGAWIWAGGVVLAEPRLRAAEHAVLVDYLQAGGGRIGAKLTMEQQDNGEGGGRGTGTARAADRGRERDGK
jgi:hypothetical protein